MGVCDTRDIVCPLQCGQSIKGESRLKDHLSKDCVNANVVCSVCRCVVKRKDKGAHSCFAEFQKQLKDKDLSLAEQKEKIETLSQELRTKDQEIKRRQEELSFVLREKDDEIRSLNRELQRLKLGQNRNEPSLSTEKNRQMKELPSQS